MRIAVTRTGGFAGITRKAELETAGRPDAPQLTDLARAALAAGRSAAPPGARDAFQYEITIGDATIHCADPEVSEAQRALIRAVLSAEPGRPEDEV
ncbi:hypothetical protein NGB36_15595 [Streptomyces sp. RB6PN25]|uniref:Metalloprotease n=1 Tax=Streptomyces humicola TaxID=2953240 RepID=A0ABT1PWE6_9ACTN|nr:protealysin inhibitor emfourin [Streptomyces humicola]MCQ4081994.1 hypothetical protein [Streptomyces humicola]